MPSQPDQVTQETRAKIAINLAIDVDRIRWHNATDPGLFGEIGWRWEIFYRDQWRELPWNFNGPLEVTRALVRRWYG